MTKETFISIMAARLGIEYTEEQEAFITDFGAPMISFSLPGTGKTATAVAALITAEHFDKVPGNQITALSFTVNATAEIKVRHETALSKLGKGKQKVVFKTLSKICKDILSEHYELLGMPYFKIIPTPAISTSVDIIEGICEDQGVTLRHYQGRKILDALNFSNSSFIMDEDNLTSRYPFVKADISFELFMRNRSQIYEANRSMGTVPVGDIVLYTLELLLTHPEIAELYKAKCKIMLVDEFQDMSLLQLMVASKICQNLIVIGDINQQIYSFNGACQEIVPEYMKLHPDAKVRNLTQSFRCAQPIADYSKDIIRPNKTDGELIKGLEGREGFVTVSSAKELHSIVKSIELTFSERNCFPHTIFFLARNNYSLLPISNALFDAGVPFQVSGYKPLYQWPIAKDLVAMIDLLRRPTDPSGLWILSKFIPEFSRYKASEQNPLFKIMEKTGLAFTSINFEYSQYNIVQDIFEVFFDITERLHDNAPCFPMLTELYDVLYESSLKRYADRLETPPGVVLSALEECCANRPFRDFIANENNKKEAIDDNVRRRNGVLCATFHGAKGLEADIVHIFDADKGVIPSKKNMTAMVQAGCNYDVAREVRNERSLIYVACTRAKKELHIHYQDELSPIFVGSSVYERWDKLYEETSTNYDDVGAFLKFIGGAWCE